MFRQPAEFLPRSADASSIAIIPRMPPAGTGRRTRILWTLLAVLILVAVVPLLISHYVLIGINRDSLETLEKKYLTRSAVSIAGDLQNLLDNNREKLQQIAGSIAITGRALPAGIDPFTYASESQTIGEYITDSGDIVALRIVLTIILQRCEFATAKSIFEVHADKFLKNSHIAGFIPARQKIGDLNALPVGLSILK